MQYRLSTLFLVFFNVAASLALFGAWGLWISAVILYVSLCLNRAKNLADGITWAILIISATIICLGLLLPAVQSAHGVARRAECNGHLKQLGLALHNYHDANKHFPALSSLDKDGKPLSSWRMAVLPMMEYGSLYNSLKKDQPWNSPANAELLGDLPLVYKCPSVPRYESDLTTNYVAIIGPGTAWHDDGPVKLSDLPDGGSHTVMAVETVNSGVHWAEPRDLTVDEALEGLKTGKGLRISTAHPSVIKQPSLHRFQMWTYRTIRR